MITFIFLIYKIIKKKQFNINISILLFIFIYNILINNYFKNLFITKSDYINY